MDTEVKGFLSLNNTLLCELIEMPLSKPISCQAKLDMVKGKCYRVVLMLTQHQNLSYAGTMRKNSWMNNLILKKNAAGIELNYVHLLVDNSTFTACESQELLSWSYFINKVQNHGAQKSDRSSVSTDLNSNDSDDSIFQLPSVPHSNKQSPETILLFKTRLAGFFRAANIDVRGYSMNITIFKIPFRDYHAVI